MNRKSLSLRIFPFVDGTKITNAFYFSELKQAGQQEASGYCSFSVFIHTRDTLSYTMQAPCPHPAAMGGMGDFKA